MLPLPYQHLIWFVLLVLDIQIGGSLWYLNVLRRIHLMTNGIEPNVLLGHLYIFGEVPYHLCIFYHVKFQALSIFCIHIHIYIYQICNLQVFPPSHQCLFFF